MPLFKKHEQPPENPPKSLGKKMQALEEKIEQMSAELEEMKEKNKHAITKLGIIRFNPFKEIGGDQSFVIALLNEKNDGVLVTSYYGRDLNRVYAKEVKKGSSEYELSEEEKEAINRAIGRAIGKKKPK